MDDGRATVRIAVVGTFDVPNFGDLLFPVLARHELGRRLEDVEIVLYSYRSMSSPPWPYGVRSLGRLPEEINAYDLLLVGGGHIVRTDDQVANGYFPSEPHVHHPLGLWLTPTLLAAASGVAVAWNAVGASPELPRWMGPLVATALEAVEHAAVRDQISALALRTLVPGAAVRIVPDTAFGVRSLLDSTVDERAGAAVEQARAGGAGYVVVQPSSAMADERPALLTWMDAARRQGLAVLELPVCPVHGDAAGVLDLPGRLQRPDEWPEPLVLAELLSAADGVAAESLHAGIVAVASGVPVWRPGAIPTGKHAVLQFLPRVAALSQADDAPGFGRTPVDPTVRALAAQVDAHWDAVASLAVSGRARTPSPALLRLVSDLPRLLGAAAAEDEKRAAERWRATEFEVGYAAATARVGELAAELRKERRRAARLEEDLAQRRKERGALDAEVDRLRETERALELVVNGGWWALRERLRGWLRVARALRRRRS